MSHGWEFARLKYIADCNMRVLPESTDADYEFTYVDIGNVSQGWMNLDSEPIRFRNSPSRARRIAVPGDSVVSTVRTYLRAVATVPEHDEPLVFSTGFAVLHPRPAVVSQFLAYYLQSDDFVDRVVASSEGVSYPAIAASKLMSLGLRLPPLGSQRAIAHYLDRETAQIDALIAKQEVLIETLYERRAAALDRVVANVSADSIPLRYLAENVTVGIVVQPAQWYVEEGVLALRGTNVKPERLELDDLVYLSEDGHRQHSKSRLAAGDVVVVRTGQSGSAVVIPPELEGANAIDLLIVRPGPALDGEYLAMLLNAPVTRDLSAQEVVGSIQGHLNVSSLRGLSIAAPSIAKQRELVDEWRSISSKIDALIAKAEEFISLSKERRSALITAAVTGQIDVQGAA